MIRAPLGRIDLDVSLDVAAEDFKQLDDERVRALPLDRTGQTERSGGRKRRSKPLPYPRRQVRRLVQYEDRERAYADLGLTGTGRSPTLRTPYFSVSDSLVSRAITSERTSKPEVRARSAVDKP